MIGRLFIFTAFPAMWFNGDFSLMAAVGWGLFAFICLLVIDDGRGIRTLPSTIIARFMFGVSLFGFVVFYLFANEAAGRTYWTLADCVVVPFWVTLAITILFWS